MSEEKLKEELQSDQELETPEEVDSEETEELELEKSPEEQLAAAQAESNELRDKVLRVAAEFENYKKRMERERMAMLKYSGARTQVPRLARSRAPSTRSPRPRWELASDQ